MTKIGFLIALSEKLSALPKKELEERLNFYSEIIEDKMEEGLSEEEAVADIGDVESIAAQIAEEIPLTKLVKEKIKPKRKLQTWEIVLIVVGAPMWVSLLVAAVAAVFSLYVSLWAVIVSFWAAFVSVALSAVLFPIIGIYYIATKFVLNGFILIGMGLFLSGLSIFTYFGCKYLTIWTAKLLKITLRFVKRGFVRKADERNEKN